MYYERLNEICKQHGTTPTALLKKLGLSTSKVTAWKNGSLPKMDTMQLISKELKVPISTFFDEDVPEPLPEDAAELLDIYRQLGKSGKRQLIGKAYELLDSQQTPPSGDEISPPNINLVSTVLDRGINTKK